MWFAMVPLCHPIASVEVQNASKAIQQDEMYD